ncbi:MAG: LysR family transcriptional regulator [Myxococcota bacterium]
MDVQQLQLLIAVVREGSFAGAARQAKVHPSAVSRAITALERELGFRLLQRSTRSLTVTEAGERYLDRVQPLVTGLADAARFARDAHDVLAGPVRATVPTSFAWEALTPLLPELTRRFPHIAFDWVVTDRRLDLLESRLDFAVRLGQVADAQVVAQRVVRMTYRLVASPGWVEQHGRPDSLDALPRDQGLVFPLDGAPGWRFRGPNGPVDVAIRGRLHASNTRVLRDAAERGLGITVLPDWLVDESVADGRLVVLLPALDVTLTTFDASVWLVLPTRRYVPARVRAVCDALRDAWSANRSADPGR